MNKTVKIILLAIAALLIMGGIGGIAYYFFSDADTPDSSDSSEATEAVHDDVEKLYDEEGNLKSEVYYKDNVYDGQTDYYSGNTADYTITYDKDRNEIASTVTESNAAGSITKITSYEDHAIIEITEYDYYEDMRTVAKKTVKVYEGEDEHAEKTYYAEAGHKTRVCTYLNGELVSEAYYDESGNTVKGGGETVEE